MDKNRKLLFAILPLAALAALVYGIVNFDTSKVLSEIPPVEEITFERTTLTPGEIRIDFINGYEAQDSTCEDSRLPRAWRC